MSIVDNKNDFLYKKNLGVVAAQGPTVSYQSETAGNARSRIISNLQLFAQPIPRDAPKLEDLGPKKYVKADGSSETDNKDNGLGLGTVQTSLTYPYIQYVDSLKLSTASKYAYYFNNPGVSTNTNLLSNAIPYNYNPSNTSWAYKVTSSNYSGNVDPSLYIVDTDAGYLYFVNTIDWDTTYGTPYISFYRYNGTIGIPTNIGNFAGAYSQGTGAIAYGDRAGYTGQRANALAIGNYAGAYGQGTGSIAIGNLAGPTGMSANSIVLNASGTALAGTGPTGGFYVAPVASYSGSMGPFTLLAYGADKQIVSVTGDALTAMNIVGGGGGGGGANYNIGNDIILSGATGGVPTRPVENDDGGFYVSPVLGYTGSSSTTFNVLGYGSSDKEVITLPITLNTKDVLTPMTINNNLQLPTLATGNLTYINNSGLLSSTDVTVAQLVNMSGVNPTNSIAIGNGAGQINQGANSIAIGNGAGQTNQPANTIAINASGTALNPSMSNGCYIAPIAGVSNSMSTFFNLLGYGSDNQIVKSNVFINSTGNSIINNYSPAKEDIGYFLKAGNASFYIGDDYSSLPTGSGLTYGRYFGTGGNIFQDFSGSFIWRRVTNASNALATSSTCMTLDNNGNLSMGGIITANGIGIGTTSPGFTLDVYGNVRFTIGIRIDSGSVNCLGKGNGNGLLLNHASGGTCEIYNGGVDTFNPTGINNLMIRSWNGIGFQSYDNTVRVAIDTRGGNISATGNITATGNISAGNVYSNSVSIYKIPIHSRNHQTIGLRVPTSGVYLVSALGESTGWYNFAILGVNTSGNVVASNALIPISNIYLNISNFEVTMAIPGGYDWLGENYKISVTRI